MYEEDDNASNTQNPDEHTPVNNTPGVDGQPEEHQNTPTPNNGEGGDLNGSNPPADGEDDDDEDMSDQGSGVNSDNRQ